MGLDEPEEDGDSLCWGCCLLSDELSVGFESEMCDKDKERCAAEDTTAIPAP